MKRTFIYTDGKSNKFWTIDINGAEFTVTYGKVIGSTSQTSTKSFADEATCQKEANKLIAEKTKKGYVEETTVKASKISIIQTPEGQQAPITAMADKKSKSEAQKAKQLLDTLNKWLEKNDIEECIEFTEPVSIKEIEKAEKKLGVKLPPSYVEFVTRYGAFYFDGELSGRGSGNDTNLLDPSEMVEKTLEYRSEFSRQSHFDEEKEITCDGLFFCADPDEEYYYLFVISSATASGEMNVRSFDYQDLGMNDPWHEGDKTFYTAIEEIVDMIKENNQ